MAKPAPLFRLVPLLLRLVPLLQKTDDRRKSRATVTGSTPDIRCRNVLARREPSVVAGGVGGVAATPEVLAEFVDHGQHLDGIAIEGLKHAIADEQGPDSARMRQRQIEVDGCRK